MKPLPRAIALLLSCFLLLGWSQVAAAQTETPAEKMIRDKPPVVPPSQEEAGVEELSVHTVWMEDENGQLVPVLKPIKYEEWEQIYKATLELANPDVPPRYALESFKLSGKVVEGAVDLTLDVELQIMADGWIRIPLRMSRAALRQPLECAAGEQCFLEYDKEGYVLWIQAASAKSSMEDDEANQETPSEAQSQEESPDDDGSLADENADEEIPAEENVTEVETDEALPTEQPVRRRSYRLHLTVPLENKAGEHLMSLDLPRKAVSSELSLLIEEKVKLITPPMLRVERQAAGEGLVRVAMTGVSGDFRLRWQNPQEQATKPELDVHSLSLAELSGPRTIKSTVRLRVRSLTGPLRNFSVLLPPGMSLLPMPASEEYQLVPADTEAVPASNDRKRVTIQLTSPTTEPFEVTLAASATRPAKEQYTQFEVTGFEVPEAKLQSGHIALSVEGDWILHWTAENDNLRQVDVLPDEQMERELAAWKPKNVITRLHCLSFPTNLRVRVTPQRSLIQVEPSYQVFVSENQLALEATLNYRVRGRKLELLELDLNDWQLPTIGPESLIRLEAVVNEKGVHLLPLQQATGSDFTIKLRATQQLDARGDKFSFKLPQLRTNQSEREQLSVAPAVLALIADDNVAVSPMINQIVGLVPESNASLESLPQREQPPRIYRQRNDNSTAAEFAGHLQIMPQSVAVESLIELMPANDQIQVDIRFQYTVRHKPLEWLMLEVPPRLVTPEGIAASLQLDGEPIVPTLLPSEEGQPSSVLLTLPEARQGSFELRASYLWKTAPPESASDQSVIGLVKPSSELTFAATSSRLHLGEQNLLRLADVSAWKPVAESELPDTARATPWQFRADQLLSEVSLRPRATDQESLRRTTVRLAWYQTWLTNLRRRDRAVFLVESSQRSIELQLPPGGELENMEIVVDQQAVNIPQRISARNALVVPLPRSASRETTSTEHVIELIYESSARHSSRIWQGGLARFRFAQLLGSDPERVYWQLVLPSNEYLWFEPEGVTSETHFTMPSWLAPAPPTLTQHELEQWSKAMPTPPPAAGANVYLFSSFGQLQEVQTGIVQRRAVVLLGAGLILALALPLIYLPVLRGWQTLLAMGLGLLLLGLAFPFPAQLLGSSVVAGFLLVLLARFLQIILSRRRYAPRILPPRDSKLGQTTQPAYTLESEERSSGSSHGTTATAPAVYSPTIGKPEASS